jgi:hypothetical protein
MLSSHDNNFLFSRLRQVYFCAFLLLLARSQDTLAVVQYAGECAHEL